MLCKYWKEKGGCANGSSCSFRHGIHDPRPSLRQIAPPASYDTPCRYHFGKKGGCAQGARCPFAHSRYEADEMERRRKFQNFQNPPIPPTHIVQQTASSVFKQQTGGPPLPAHDDVSKLTVLKKDAVSENEPAEVPWELPSEEPAVYQYGGGFNGVPPQYQQPQQPWNQIALQHMPVHILQAEAEAEAAQRMQFMMGQQQLMMQASLPIPARPVCQFFLQGDCRYGLMCRYAHIMPMMNNTEAMMPVMNAGPPILPAMNAELPMVLPMQNPDSIECNICYELVTGGFGLLTGCNHPFCLKCLREWRQKGLAGGDAKAVRSCPVCREPSHFVVPSSHFPSDPDEKAVVVERYKSTLAARECMYLKKGEECPFGSSCFYAHLTPDGQRVVPTVPRYVEGANGREILGDGAKRVQLSQLIHD